MVFSTEGASQGGEKRPLEDLCAMRGVNRETIERMINALRKADECFRVRNLSLYTNALTHRSSLKEFHAPRGSNERLELMGDSVINLVVTDLLYRMFPKEDEGFLTRVRTKLVRGESLCGWARLHRMDELIMMNSKALEQGWYNNPKKLEDTFEAIVGAMYLDMGMNACKSFIENIVDKHVDFETVVQDDNYKDRLTRKMQCVHSDMVANNMNRTQYGEDIMPVYSVVGTSGNDHQKIFHVQVAIEGNVLGHGSAPQKRQAEQLAAQEALGKIGF